MKMRTQSQRLGIISKKIMPKAMENYNPKMRNNRGVIIFDYRG